MKIISICNQKGGVGKTTTSQNLAAALAQLGQRVLVADLDPQRNATTALNRGEYRGYGINDLIYFTVSGTPFELGSYIRRNEVEGVDYIPASPVLSAAPGILANDRDSSLVLARLFHAPYFDANYDYLLIDCKPSLDLLVVNALAASHQVLIPTEPEDFALDGLADLLITIHRIQDSFNEGLDINGILVTKANMTRKKTGEVIQQLRQNFGCLVLNTVIPNLAEAGRALDEGVSLVHYTGSRLGRLYMDAAKEVMER